MTTTTRTPSSSKNLPISTPMKIITSQNYHVLTNCEMKPNSAIHSAHTAQYPWKGEQDCQLKCRANPTCAAFVHDNEWCKLKPCSTPSFEVGQTSYLCKPLSSCAAEHKNTRLSTPIKIRPTQQQHCVKEPNTAIHAPHIARYPWTNVEDCQQKCKAHEDCVAFVHDGKYCNLKSCSSFAATENKDTYICKTKACPISISDVHRHFLGARGS